MYRIDERDVIFARMNYVQGSPEYEDYYRKNPDKREFDDELRAGFDIGGEGTATYNKILSPFFTSGFDVLAELKQLTAGTKNPLVVDADKEYMTKLIKNLSKYVGAKVVGITRLKDYHLYTHRGRNNKYGEKVVNNNKFAIVLGFEMDKDMINRAPQLEQAFAVTKAYMDGAYSCLWISKYIQNLGYDSRAHIDGDYEIIAPILARDAGLGVFGRNSILINLEYGQRLRFAAITTDLELLEDEEIEFDMKRFCEICGKCSRSCPGKAISQEQAKEYDGFTGWNIVHEQCYQVWTRVGTDCGVCLSVCPFSQGIDQVKLSNINSDDDISEILKEHEDKYGIRPYIKTALDIINIKIGE